MNQILAVEIEKKKERKKSSIKSIVIAFCVFLLIFGISLTSSGAYAVITNIKNKKSVQDELGEEPSISMDRESANIEKIVVTSKIGISRVKYKINDSDEVEIDGNKQTRVQKEIELEPGQSTIIVTAENIKGKKETREFNAEAEEVPKIKLEQIETKIQITVEYSKIIDTVKYFWDNDETNAKTFTINDVKNVTQVDMIQGRHVLNVIATDKEGREFKKSQELFVDFKPDLDITTDGQNFFIKASDDEAVIKVEITLNNHDTIVEEINEKEYNKTIQVENGENKLKVKVYNKNGITNVKGVKYTK